MEHIENLPEEINRLIEESHTEFNGDWAYTAWPDETRDVLERARDEIARLQGLLFKNTDQGQSETYKRARHGLVTTIERYLREQPDYTNTVTEWTLSDPSGSASQWFEWDLCFVAPPVDAFDHEKRSCYRYLINANGHIALNNLDSVHINRMRSDFWKLAAQFAESKRT